MSNIQDFNFLPLNKKLKEVSDEFGFIDPVTLLQGLANGKDLRSHSLAIEWLLKHESENGVEPPDEWEWLEFVDLIKKELKFSIVSIETSKDAQKTLTEYLHSKKKSLDIKEEAPASSVEPLTNKDIRRFKRIFNREY